MVPSSNLRISPFAESTVTKIIIEFMKATPNIITVSMILVL
jgi:hypothetical protein